MTAAPASAARSASVLRRERPAPAVRSVARRDVTGKELGTVELDAEIFGIEPNEAVLHQVVTAQLAAGRSGTQSTKTRAEVRGGGSKPYRQKGTGRARQGSIRSPLWTGGGVALGPKPRSYRQKTPKKMVRLALCSALSDRAAAERVALVDGWRFEVPKTKDAVAALRVLGLEGRVLVVLEHDDEAAARSFANLPRVRTVAGGAISAYDVIRSDWVVFTDATLPRSRRDETESAATTTGPTTGSDGGDATDATAAGASEERDTGADVVGDPTGTAPEGEER